MTGRLKQHAMDEVERLTTHLIENQGYSLSAAALAAYATVFGTPGHPTEDGAVRALNQGSEQLVRHMGMVVRASENARKPNVSLYDDPIAYALSVLCSLRKNYREDNGLWEDADRAIALLSETHKAAGGQ